MKKFTFTLSVLFLFTTSLNAHIHHFGDSTFEEVNPNYYKAKIADQNLWLVMERVTDLNRKDWLNFIDVQSHSDIVETASRNLKNGGSTSAGSFHFRDALTSVYHQKNEVWVAYITAISNPQPLTRKFENYTCDDAVPENGEFFRKLTFANRLKMFVTIVSSPNAKITSHMGIAFPCESTFFPKKKGLSMHLHSFAAKVMKVRNPERHFMLGEPAPIMELTLARSLPEGAMHIAHKEKFEFIKKYKEMSFEEYKIGREFTPDALLREEFEGVKSYYAFQYLMHAIAGCSKESFKALTFQEKRGYREACDELIRKRPPIISLKGSLKAPKLRIYNPGDPTQLWLEILPDDTDYNFVFTKAFLPQGMDHLVAVDLKALAECKICE